MSDTRPMVGTQFRLAGGALLVHFTCSCGFATGWLDVRGDSGAAIRRHLAEEHSAVVGFGICASCDAVTDYFHAHVPDLDTDVWACERCGPKVPTVVDQGPGPAGDGSAPYDTLRSATITHQVRP